MERLFQQSLRPLQPRSEPSRAERTERDESLSPFRPHFGASHASRHLQALQLGPEEINQWTTPRKECRLVPPARRGGSVSGSADHVARHWCDSLRDGGELSLARISRGLGEADFGRARIRQAAVSLHFGAARECEN